MKSKSHLRLANRLTAAVMTFAAIASVVAQVERAPGDRMPLPYRVSARLGDRAEILSPSAIRIDGWLGRRIALNEKVRLLQVDTEPLLAGFREKPGSHPWIGEHIGKWLHAATLAWANTGDPALRAKLDRAATELIAAQEPDGYLGTYVPINRFTGTRGSEWDVWSHRYCLVGLLTYYQFTGVDAALQASRKAADLLIATFPAKRSILASSSHLGISSTTVLESIVLLYRLTGEPRYLEFARYIVAAWDEPKGPEIMKSLLAQKGVRHVGNAKAYQMLANILGLCDLARVTGDTSLVEASRSAWQDIVSHHLYITGTASQREYFGRENELLNHLGANIGETCVTTTWIQLNLSLLQLTGEARFGDEIERTCYNHLTAAQHPRGDDWCYFTALEGRKQYDAGITCCHSSGPRGLALVPQASYLRMPAEGGDILLVSTFESSRARLTLGGQAVTVEQQSGFPRTGSSTLTLRLAAPATFAIKFRVPPWAAPLSIPNATVRDGWAELPPQIWKDGDRIAVSYNLSARLIRGQHSNDGRSALAWGPFVLACERDLNPTLAIPALLGFDERAVSAAPLPGDPLVFDVPVVGPAETRGQTAKFLTYADAGADRGVFRVWLRAPGVASAPGDSLLMAGRPSSSDGSSVAGSINDEDLESVTSASSGQREAPVWFAVDLVKPATAQRVVFTNGSRAPNGGWFDTSAGKPRVEIRRTANAPWEQIGVLTDYPTTTATKGDGLRPQLRLRKFSLVLATPVTFAAVRVVGMPARGTSPQQAFVSCAELQAFLQ